MFFQHTCEESLGYGSLQSTYSLDFAHIPLNSSFVMSIYFHRSRTHVYVMLTLLHPLSPIRLKKHQKKGKKRKTNQGLRSGRMKPTCNEKASVKRHLCLSFPLKNHRQGMITYLSMGYLSLQTKPNQTKKIMTKGIHSNPTILSPLKTTQCSPSCTWSASSSTPPSSYRSSSSLLLLPPTARSPLSPHSPPSSAP